MFIRGKDLIFYIVIDGQNVPIAHYKTSNLNTTAATLPTTTLQSGKGETNDYSRKYAYTIKGDGLVFIDDYATGLTLQDLQVTFTKVSWTFTDNVNVQWFGVCLITMTEITSDFDSVSLFSSELLGDGEYTFIQANVPPIPPIGASVTINDQFGNVIASIQAPGAFSVTKFNAIDCGNAFQNPSAITITA